MELKRGSHNSVMAPPNLIFKESEKKHRTTAVFLLIEFILHLLDGCFKEKGDQELIGALCTFGAQGINVFLAVFLKDNEFGQTVLQKDEVREQSSRSAVTVTERMKIFKKNMKPCR